jgi:hypothetical protein
MIQTLTIALLITNIVVILMYWFKPKTEQHIHILNVMDKEKGETLTKLYEGSKTPNEVINGEKQN